VHVVVAFAHYRGRLGYLLNSGVVGVLFEDASHMLTKRDIQSLRYEEPPSMMADSGAAAGGAASTAADQDVSTQAAPAARKTKAVSTDAGRHASTDVLQVDQSPAARQGADQAAAAAGPDGHLAGCQARLAPSVHEYRLPAPQQGCSSSDRDASSAPACSSTLPEQLSSKLRCLQRFAGCLLHHQPYSSKRHLDVTRLALPEPLGLQQQGTCPPASGQQGQEGEAKQQVWWSDVVHVQHFNYSEGCVLLTLTDGSQQLVFTSDGSVMLLHPGAQQLAFVTPPRRHRHRGSAAGPHSDTPQAGSADGGSSGSSSASESDDGSDSDTPGSNAGTPARLVLLDLCQQGGAVSPQNPRMLARIQQASRLPGVLPLPLVVCTP
jgi:hypothetical protein